MKKRAGRTGEIVGNPHKIITPLAAQRKRGVLPSRRICSAGVRGTRWDSFERRVLPPEGKAKRLRLRNRI
jgi:hypothetical protein